MNSNLSSHIKQFTGKMFYKLSKLIIYLHFVHLYEPMSKNMIRKTYFPHINPMLHFSDKKFQKRYRFSKDIERDLATQYGNSEFCSTQLDTKGGGLSADERVRTFSIMFSYLNKMFFIIIMSY